MKEIHVDAIVENIREMCIEANLSLSPDMKEIFSKAVKQEE